MPACPNGDFDLRLAETILRIRLGQMIVNDGIQRKKFNIPIHLALGHEAIAAATDAIMSPCDWLCVPHRNIHYNLARGDSLKSELAELHLQQDGVAGGKFGSMNMVNPAQGIIYASSILGNDIAVAAGVALAERIDPTGAVVFAVTGDGAMEEGAFYEGVEFLKSAGLAAIIIVENNGWSMFTRISERRCAIDLAALSRAFDVNFETLRGNDPWDYAAKLLRLRNLAAEAKAPAIVEVEVTTLGHTVASDGRFINYHHGVAPVMDSDWPMIREDESDPMHIITKRIGESTVREMARRIHGALLQEAHANLH
jgi:TPP-dependent pyruvate/acetoin dehydrogenase alpha subunit